MVDANVVEAARRILELEPQRPLPTEYFDLIDSEGLVLEFAKAIVAFVDADPA